MNQFLQRTLLPKWSRVVGVMEEEEEGEAGWGLVWRRALPHWTIIFRITRASSKMAVHHFNPFNQWWKRIHISSRDWMELLSSRNLYYVESAQIVWLRLARFNLLLAHNPFSLTNHHCQISHWEKKGPCAMQVGHVAVHFGRYDFLPPVTFHYTGFAYPDGRCCGLRGVYFPCFWYAFEKHFVQIVWNILFIGLLETAMRPPHVGLIT